MLCGMIHKETLNSEKKKNLLERDWINAKIDSYVKDIIEYKYARRYKYYSYMVYYELLESLRSDYLPDKNY